ncbi:MAG: hypothetical protein IPO62_12990 [Saprospiraceae bacterium]|nr:hypothetical protein [Saprospiraceae bacterium]
MVGGMNESGIISLVDMNGKSILQTRFVAGQNVIKLDLVNGFSFGGTYLFVRNHLNELLQKRLTIVK